VKDVFECNPDYNNFIDGWDDMVTMNVLNEPEIIANVKLRYHKDAIFTFIGPTLIVMNPYKKIEALFNQKVFD
jgi:myosin-7